jgi:hypothetical protein
LAGEIQIDIAFSGKLLISGAKDDGKARRAGCDSAWDEVQGRTARWPGPRMYVTPQLYHGELNVYAAQMSRKSLVRNLICLNSDLLAHTVLRTHGILSPLLRALTLTSPLGRVRFGSQDAYTCSLTPSIGHEVIYKYVKL